MGCVGANPERSSQEPNQHQQQKNHSHIIKQPEPQPKKPLPMVNGGNKKWNEKPKKLENRKIEIKYEQFLEFPKECFCPLTYGLFEDPVLTVDGHTYERRLIEGWFKRGKDTSPLTNLKLSSKILIPNIALRNMINNYKQKINLSYMEAAKKRDVEEVVEEMIIRSQIKKEHQVKQEKKQTIKIDRMEEFYECLMCSKKIKNKDFLQQFGICRPCHKKQIKLQAEIMIEAQSNEPMHPNDNIIHFLRNSVQSNQPFIDIFWQVFNEQEWSIWKLDCVQESKNEVTEKEFLASNFMHAFARRFDDIRGEVFGIVGVYKKNDRYSIGGVLIWKGVGIHPVLEEQDALHSVTVKKLRINEEADRAIVSEYWGNRSPGEWVEDKVVIKISLVK